MGFEDGGGGNWVCKWFEITFVFDVCVSVVILIFNTLVIKIERELSCLKICWLLT